MIQKLGIFFVFLTVVFETTANTLKLNNFLENILPLSDIIKDTNKNLKSLAPQLEEYSKLGKYNHRFIDALNSFETMNNHQIVFDSDEINVLTFTNHGASLIQKQFIQLKYFRKMQDFQCTNYVILQCLIPHVKFLAERLVLWADYGTSDYSFHIVRNFVYSNFIKTAFEGNYVIYGWLWGLYIKLVAFSFWEHSYRILTEDTFGFDKLEKTLDQLINQCQYHGYLVKGYKEKYRLINTEDDFEYLHNVVMESYSLWDDKLEEVDSNEYATVEQFFLKPFWHDNSLIFQQVNGVEIEWNTLKKTLDKEQNEVSLQFQNGNWITNPYGHVIYQHMFLNIIKVHILCHIRLHLFIYRNQNDGIRSEIDKSDSASKIFKSLELFNVGDKFLNNLLEMFNKLKPFNPQELDDLIGRVENQTKAIVIKLNELHRKSRELICIDKNIANTKTLDKNTNQTEGRTFATIMEDKGVIIKFINSLDTIVLANDPVKFLETNAMELFEYINEISSKLKFAELSFFISGSKNTNHIFFPNRS